jgi:microsomal dipeptidase-like Zn-dependent dipeptidase
MELGQMSEIMERDLLFAGFPDQPEWFRDNRDFINIANGLVSVGFNNSDVDLIMGKNWLNFFEASFKPL